MANGNLIPGISLFDYLLSDSEEWNGAVRPNSPGARLQIQQAGNASQRRGNRLGYAAVLG